MKRIILCLCLIASPAFAALAVNVNWDVRSGGVDTNGGGFDPNVTIPGQDFSQQNAAQVSFTDLVIGGTTTQLTSALSAFATCTAGVGRCGNIINITGGAGCTVGWYEILSTSTITATMDRSVGTAASTCTGKLGGSLLTLGKALALAVTGNTVWMKSATFSFGASTNIPAITMAIRGYQTSHGDGAANTTLSVSAGFDGFIQANGAATWFDHITFLGSGTGNLALYGPASGSSQAYLTDCVMDTWAAMLYGNGQNFSYVWAARTTFKNQSSTVAWATGAIEIRNNAFLVLQDCLFQSNNHDIDNAFVGMLQCHRCVFHSSTNSSFVSQSGGAYVFDHCVWYGCGVSGNQTAVEVQNIPKLLAITDCAFYSNYRNMEGFNLNVTLQAQYGTAMIISSNATGNASFSRPDDTAMSVLSSDPFTNAASNDFSTNATAGGGAVLRNAAVPGSTPAGTTYEDIGALRHQDPAGGGTHGYTFSRNKLPEGVLGVSLPQRARDPQ